MSKILFILFFSISLFGSSKTTNIDLLLDKAKKEDKHLLIFFHMTYCGYCNDMIDESFRDKEIQKILNDKFIFVDINVNDRDQVIYNNFKGLKYKFAQKSDVFFYPTIFFIDKNNKRVYKVKGYRSKDKFTNILNYISSKSYKKIDYPSYLDYIEMEK